MKIEQEPKYDARLCNVNGVMEPRLVNRQTGEYIPDDEPVFILRAKDRRALAALQQYYRVCENAGHRDAIGDRIIDFTQFADENPDRMQEPTT